MKIFLAILVLAVSEQCASQLQYYAFDNVNRLIQIDNGNCSGIKYTYDSNSNRLSRYDYNIQTKDSTVNETCPNANDGSISLTSYGDFSYAWSNGQTTPMIKSLAPGNYSVVIKDNPTGATCSKSFIIYPQFVDSFSIKTTDISCYSYNDGTSKANIIINDPRAIYAFNWSNAKDTTYYSVDTTTNLPAGNYAVHVRNSYTGCIDTIPFTITQPAPIISSIQKNDNTCFGITSGSATVVPSTNSSDYQYAWTSKNFTQQQATQRIDSLVNGSYFIEVTENFGNKCVLEDTVTINGPTQGDILSVKTDSTSTSNSNDGVATAHVVGDTSKYLYEWSDNSNNKLINQFTATVTGLPTGNYTLTITSLTADSCKSSLAFTIPVKNQNNIYSLFPNPTNGFVYVTTNTQTPLDVSYKLISSTGQTMIANRTIVSNGQVITINLTAYPNGIYFIQLMSNNQSQTLQVIKQ